MDTGLTVVSSIAIVCATILAGVKIIQPQEKSDPQSRDGEKPEERKGI
jgi:hypothetical protein